MNNNKKADQLEIPLDHRALLREARRDGRPPVVHQLVQEWTPDNNKEDTEENENEVENDLEKIQQILIDQEPEL